MRRLTVSSTSHSIWKIWTETFGSRKGQRKNGRSSVQFGRSTNVEKWITIAKKISRNAGSALTKSRNSRRIMTVTEHKHLIKLSAIMHVRSFRHFVTVTAWFRVAMRLLRLRTELSFSICILTNKIKIWFRLKSVHTKSGSSLIIEDLAIMVKNQMVLILILRQYHIF